MNRLSLIGLGMVDERSVPLRGMDRLVEADRIFCELFTSLMERGSIERLEEMIGKGIEVVLREDLEDAEVVMGALESSSKVCLLTAGDPLTATTHQELRLDALKKGFKVEVIHSGSVFTAAASAAGLQHYKFGRATTIAFPEGNFFPTSPLEVICGNLEMGLHTLALLDIRAHEERYMTAPEGCDIILRMEDTLKTGKVDGGTMAVAVARAGRSSERILYETLDRIRDTDIGEPPHCLIIPGRLHFMEEEMLLYISE